MPCYIRLLKVHGIGEQPIRNDGPKSHLETKAGIPTAGGLVVLTCFLFSVLLWCNLSNLYVRIVTISVIAYALLGFIDDYRKLKYHNSRGISGKTKLLWQFILAVLAVFAIVLGGKAPTVTRVFFHIFFIDTSFNLSWMFILWGAFVIVGSSNAVNLSDGLDGLATGLLIIVILSFGFISYFIGDAYLASYFHLEHISGVNELTIVCAALIGANLGFLFFNSYPARIFMGDVGSLAMGCAIGVISLITKHEITLAIIGGVFVIEAISVIVQIYYFKFTGGKRLFKMAPIHHHFERLGMHEGTVVTRFWIAGILLAFMGLSAVFY